MYQNTGLTDEKTRLFLLRQDVEQTEKDRSYNNLTEDEKKLRESHKQQQERWGREMFPSQHDR